MLGSRRRIPISQQSRPSIVGGICLFLFIATCMTVSLVRFLLAGALWPQTWSDVPFIAVLVLVHLLFVVGPVIGIVELVSELRRRWAGHRPRVAGRIERSEPTNSLGGIVPMDRRV